MTSTAEIDRIAGSTICAVREPRMFGIVTPMVSHGTAVEDFLSELVGEAQAAEKAGLDLCLVPEHHQGPPNALPNALTVAGWLLANTRDLMVGTGIMLLPLYDPVLIAEQTGILQAASRGRLIVGVGAGYQPQDFEIFGVDRSERVPRLERGVEVLRRAWSGEDVNGQRIIPTPEEPPELWFGASSSPAIRRAAQLGDALLTNPIYTTEKLTRMAKEYRAAVEGNGRTGRVILLKELWIGDTDEEALATYGPEVENVFRYYFKRDAFGADSKLTIEDMKMSRALGSRVICGSVDTVVEGLSTVISAVGADGCVAMMRHPGGPSHEAVSEAITRFGKEVVPRVKLAVA